VNPVTQNANANANAAVDRDDRRAHLVMFVHTFTWKLFVGLGPTPGGHGSEGGTEVDVGVGE
jgi:hypothetical protein